MNSLSSLFGGTSSFEKEIRQFCKDQSWAIDTIDSEHAVIKFGMSSGRTQPLWIVKHGSTLEFSVPSALVFDSEDALPGFISSLLLRANAKNKIGFWCVEEIGDKFVYSFMHNAEMDLINSEYFARVSRFLCQECDRLEGVILDALGKS